MIEFFKKKKSPRNQYVVFPNLRYLSIIIEELLTEFGGVKIYRFNVSL